MLTEMIFKPWFFNEEKKKKKPDYLANLNISCVLEIILYFGRKSYYFYICSKKKKMYLFQFLTKVF